MSELAPIHIVLAPHDPYYGSQVAQELTGYQRLGFEFVGATREERSGLEAAFTWFVQVGPSEPFTDAEAADLQTWVSHSYIASTLMELQPADAKVTLIDVSSEDPEYGHALAYEHAKQDRLTAFIGSSLSLTEAQERVVQLGSRAITTRDGFNARAVHELGKQDSQGLAVVTGLAHVGLRPLLEQRGHEVTIAEVGVSGNYLPYDVQIHRQLHAEGRVNPTLVQRALLVDLHSYYDMVQESRTSGSSPLAMAGQRGNVQKLPQIQRGIEYLHDDQVHALVRDLEGVLQSRDKNATDKINEVIRLLPDL